ncbi:MAG TPA: hypothetical protein VF173_34610 [Thermoanaerobaculia bacterium]|nr:hypothetical protein [Thermoanaerobaculia bacterium]
MAPAFDDFQARYRPDRYQRYVDGIAAAIGHRYTYSTTPLFLPQGRLERIFATVRSVVRLLQSPRFQEESAREPWFLPWHPLEKRDYFGCVDFHLRGDEEKIIEVNFNPPGRFGLLELMERTFLEAFEAPTLLQLNAGFEQAVVAAVTEGDRDRRVAIAVNPTASSRELLPHYRYVESFFLRHGVQARVVFADAVGMDGEGFPVWDGERYDVVLNLLIARTWRDHPVLFAPYTALFQRRPEVFFPSPLGARLGDKRLLAVCHQLAQDSFGLAPADVENLERATLKAWRLTDFRDAREVRERFGGEQNLVLKPLDNYRGNGVVIQPSPDELAAIFAQSRDNYMAHEYFPAEPVPCLTPEGGDGAHPFEVRVGFLNGEVRSVRGSSCINLDMTPAVVV